MESNLLLSSTNRLLTRIEIWCWEWKLYKLPKLSMDKIIYRGEKEVDDNIRHKTKADFKYFMGEKDEEENSVLSENKPVTSLLRPLDKPLGRFERRANKIKEISPFLLLQTTLSWWRKSRTKIITKNIVRLCAFSYKQANILTNAPNTNLTLNFMLKHYLKKSILRTFTQFLILWRDRQ